MSLAAFAPHLFGAPIGMLAQQESLLAAAKGAATIENLLAEAALRPAQAQHYLTEAAKNQFLIREGEAKLARDEAFAQNLQQVLNSVAADPNASLENVLTKVALASLGAGFTKEGINAATAAATLGLKAAQESVAKATAAQTLLQSKLEMNKLLGGLMANVKSQQDLDKANALFTTITGLPSPLAGVTYDPKIVEAVHTAAIGAAKQAELDLRRVIRDVEQEYKDQVLQLRQRLVDIENKKLELRRELLEQTARTTGNRQRAPTNAELQAVKRQLRDRFPDIDLGVAESAAIDIATEAQRMVRENPGLPFGQAVSRAISDAIRRGDIQHIPGGFLRRSRSAHVTGGTTPDDPLPMPSPKDVQSGKVNLIEGRFYVSPHGAVFRWEGGKWREYTRAPAEASRPFTYDPATGTFGPSR